MVGGFIKTLLSNLSKPNSISVFNSINGLSYFVLILISMLKHCFSTRSQILKRYYNVLE